MLALHNIAHSILFSAYILSYFINKYNSFVKFLLHNAHFSRKEASTSHFCYKTAYYSALLRNYIKTSL